MREKPLILVVDDEKDLLEIMYTALISAGFDAVVAHDGQEALDAAVKVQPDLILMDVRMPGQTGTDAALAIKQNPQTKNIKIAFLSNMRDPWPATRVDRVGLSKEIGMEDYIDKAEDLDLTVKKVREILARK